MGGQCGSKRRVLESQVKVLEQAVGQLREKLALEMGRRITYESQLPIQGTKHLHLLMMGMDNEGSNNRKTLDVDKALVSNVILWHVIRKENQATCP